MVVCAKWSDKPVIASTCKISRTTLDNMWSSRRGACYFGWWVNKLFQIKFIHKIFQFAFTTITCQPIKIWISNHKTKHFYLKDAFKKPMKIFLKNYLHFTYYRSLIRQLRVLLLWTQGSSNVTSTSIILRLTQLNVVLALYTRMCPDVSSLVPLIVVPVFSSDAIATSDVCEFSVVLVLICVARGLARSVNSICNESNNLEGRYMPNKSD